MLFSVLWSTVLFTGHPRNRTNSSQLVLILNEIQIQKGSPWSTYPWLSIETEATASMVKFHLGNCLAPPLIFFRNPLGPLRHSPSSGVSPLSGLSLLFCLWLMLFSSFSQTRPHRENLGTCYLSLKMSSCSWYSVKSLWKRRFCPITGRSSFNSSLFCKPCTENTKASSEFVTTNMFHRAL